MGSTFLLGVILTSLFFGSLSFAASDCSPMRLDDTSMKTMPIYDQDDIADCYAIITAQMIDAYRFSHGDADTAHRTSHYALAANYKFSDERDRMSFARDLKSFMSVPDGAMTSAEPLKTPMVLPKPFVFKKDVYINSHLELGAPAETARANRTPSGKLVSCSDAAVKRYFKKNKNFKETYELWEQSKEQKVKAPACLAIPGGSLEMKDIVENFGDESSTEEFFAGVMKKICEKESIQVDFPEIVTLGWNVPGLPDEVKRNKFVTDRKFARAGVALVNGALSLSNPQPVGIGYYPKFLTKKNAKKNEGEYHQSIIIGRRKDNAGKCEFLLRNSWGPRCNLTVSCDTRTKGQYWINAEELMTYADEVTMARDPNVMNRFIAQENK
jgi:hypothetical protein